MAEVVYGSEIAADIKAELKKQIEELKENHRRIPKLTVILIGDHAASLSYVKGKERACGEIGMDNELIALPADTSEAELLELIDRLNHDDTVDGILVQLPLPKHINEDHVIYAIAPHKDVDGFHPYNIGRMMMGSPTFLPCTPKGIMEVLKRISLKDLSGEKSGCDRQIKYCRKTDCAVVTGCECDRYDHPFKNSEYQRNYKNSRFIDRSDRKAAHGRCIVD